MSIPRLSIVCMKMRTAERRDDVCLVYNAAKAVALHLIRLRLADEWVNVDTRTGLSRQPLSEREATLLKTRNGL